MSDRYDPQAIEAKWQKIWADSHCFEAEASHDKPKFYGLIEFPYPSGQGLHVGHPRSNTAIDIICRKRRMEGFNVLFPIGWDAFGLPTENYAIKTGVHPAKVTHDNINRFREQLQRLGFSFDYTREVNTTDPDYYKWTQWIFLKFFEKGLAYKAEIPINFCTSCKVGLANEEVVDGVCERCGGPVVQKVRSQWMLRITDYAQKLLDGLEEVNFIDRVKTQQQNWIGRSEGAEVQFRLAGVDESLTVYTTRADTLFGATYMVISPEHPLIDRYADRIENHAAVAAYRAAAARKSDFERSELNKEKTGVELLGLRAINPVTGDEIPIWVSDYVLMSYGTGAIMAVPAHDTRDWEFAKKFGLPIIEVVAGGNVEEAAYTECHTGVMVNSGFLTGKTVEEAIPAMIDYLEKNGLGRRKVNYKLRDWVFTRQRYWGEPIPLVHCEHCGWVPLPYDQLPLRLPEIPDYTPSDDGSSALSRATEWMHTTCPKCGAPAIRETDTMPNWAGSSWYFLRYCDPHNDKAFADYDELKYWMPVDWYNGGMEHVTRHLIYSRFWNMFLYDIGVVKDEEPYKKRTAQGLILGSDGEKMSKSRGNVINPDDIIKEFGADTLRTFILFIGDYEKPSPWSMEGTRGCYRFLNRVWGLADMVKETPHKGDINLAAIIKKVSDDYEAAKYNTAIAQLMAAINVFYARGSVTKHELNTFLKLLYPVAPHITSEMYSNLNDGAKINEATWPTYKEEELIENEVEIPVQVNGKLRGKITVATDATQEEAIGDEILCGKTIIKVIYVKGRILNIVAK